MEWSWGLDWRLCLVSVVLGYAVLEHLTYWFKKKHMPGPRFIIPFFGSAAAVILSPTKYWIDQADAASKSGLACDRLLGKFSVFIRDPELSHKVFANVRPDAFQIAGHPFGKKLFGENNLIFMFGEEHKDLRRRLAPLFTLKALGIYVSVQEKTIMRHIDKWLEMAKQAKGPLVLRTLCRNLNLETSQNVFVGPYLTAEMREQFTKDYNLFNVGLLAFPLYIPGCAFYEATQGVKRLVAILAVCARESKKNMAAGGEPACLMDFWTTEIIREIQEAKEAGLPPPPHSSDKEVGHHLFDFLFASQDASTSSLVWAVTLLEGHPEVLAKVREEQKSFHLPHNPDKLREMKYTEMVVKEVLRFRPPATLVPHTVHCDFPITDSFTIPKGSMVFPSLYEASFQGFTDPQKFDPERFSAQRFEDQVHKRNWLTFGAGPHQCIGQRYAINQLILFVALFTTSVNFIRIRTVDGDQFLYSPTIVPKDMGLLVMSERKT